MMWGAMVRCNMSPQKLPPASPDRVLVLQGGGALGSYQAGVYEALDAQGLTPGWVAGISIGAINAALIAGNPPERRVQRLHEFWDMASGAVTFPVPFPGEEIRAFWNEMSAGWIAAFGVPGFFRPRIPPPLFHLPGAPEALSLYDTAPLRESLERLVDFDRINARETRLSVGAVNVRTGNFTYFDNMKDRIGPEHIMASGALPPGFPPVVIDGEAYWDGGIVSNTPLQYVLDEELGCDLMIFQVDLFAARGDLPRTLIEAAEREKDIRFSSRTRLNTDASLRIHKARVALSNLLGKLPAELGEDADVVFLRGLAHEPAVTIVQLIYRSKAYEGNSKDYEFSRTTMTEHWAAGGADVCTTLNHPDWLNRPMVAGTVTYDLTGGDKPAS
jgi:NTE family protein